MKASYRIRGCTLGLGWLAALLLSGAAVAQKPVLPVATDAIIPKVVPVNAVIVDPRDPVAPALEVYRKVTELYPKSTKFTFDAGNPVAERIVAVVSELLRLRGDTVISINAPTTGFELTGEKRRVRPESLTLSVEVDRGGVVQSAALLATLSTFAMSRATGGGFVWRDASAPPGMLTLPAPETADGDRYFQRGLPLETTDRAGAIAAYKLAVVRGSGRAAFRLGLLLVSSGDTAAGLPYVAQAAASNEPMALYVMGAAYAQGDGVAKDVPRGSEMLRRAAAAGIQPAADLMMKLPR